jgi:hypothetical protein
MYKQILVPDKKNHSVEVPKEFFGKKIEVTVAEVNGSAIYPAPPAGKKIEVEELFEGFGLSPDFPSAEELRSKAWPGKW